MPKYHIWTIGCQMNKADSAHIASYLEQCGCSACDRAEAADIIVVNTCVVRQSAESKAVNKLESLRHLKRQHPDLSIILTGCLVDSNTADLKRTFPHVDLFLQPQEWSVLEQWAGEFTAEGTEITEGLGNRDQGPGTRGPVTAFVPIIRGCDNFCTYCIVPYRRGREKSRPMDEIVCEVEGAVRRGAREITLLGQNVDSYGRDLPGKSDLADLLTELNRIKGLARIRFLTSHPKDMSRKLIESIAHLDKVCEHISLPVQAGDDQILWAMGRGYTAEDYRRLVREVRLAIPGVALSTDVVVGFPGETVEQFQRTFDLLQEIRFDTVHVAAYSPRSGTWAAENLKDDVPADEKKRRREAVEVLQEGIAAEINSKLLGTTVEVLVEDRKKTKWQGRTRTDKLVFFSDAVDRMGQLVKVEIKNTSPWSLQGRLG